MISDIALMVSVTLVAAVVIVIVNIAVANWEPDEPETCIKILKTLLFRKKERDKNDN